MPLLRSRLAVRRSRAKAALTVFVSAAVALAALLALLIVNAIARGI